MKLLSFFIAAVLFVSCQKENNNNNNNQQNLPAQSYSNVSYGSDAAQKMDIYLPAGRRTDTTKLIILIHGGAWVEGDKSDFTASMETIKQKLPGYAIANINYRLATQTGNYFPTQENDVKAAVNFLYNKRSEYKFSEKFVLLGGSAGGHLALLHAYKHTTPVKIKAVVSFFGPTDMAQFYNSQVNPFYQLALQLLVGGTPSGNPTAYQQSSPIFFAGAQSSPTLLLHGGLDPIVETSHSVNLKNKLQTAGVTNEYHFYPTEGHGWTGANLTHSFDKIAAFLIANVQ